jgi:Tfp pilus assembly protein PilP
MKLKHLLIRFAVALAALILTGAQLVNAQSTNDDATPPKQATTRKVAKKKPASVKESSLPSLEDRLAENRLAVRRGEQRDPSSPYLIDEMTVTGVYKSVEGYGAFLKAVNGRTFFAYSGMHFYDGEVASISPDQVVFTQTLAGGKKKQVVKVYDPSALRNSAAEQAERDKKDKDQDKEKKKTKKDAAKDDDDNADNKDE